MILMIILWGDTQVEAYLPRYLAIWQTPTRCHRDLSATLQDYTGTSPDRQSTTKGPVARDVT
jgi:hypothetical protein